jgi:hypothetical protein
MAPDNLRGGKLSKEGGKCDRKMIGYHSRDTVHIYYFFIKFSPKYKAIQFSDGD